ncbi:MAG: LicD family protein [Clostridia bacterium]|nr:LicD family protein [Clostridia bacterium]MBR5427594.1 LicD family protein [Clostridia bacterium]
MLTDEQLSVLRDIQDVELKILLELDRICQKYDIKYSLSGGTLLGAIRHKDFIPWDDDIDIDLKREDFYKLIRLLPEELGEEYSFVNYDEFGGRFCDFIPRIFYNNCKVVNSFSLDDGKTNMAEDSRLDKIFIELYCLHDTKKGIVVKTQIFLVKTVYGLAMAHRNGIKPSERYSELQKAQVGFLRTVGKYIPMKTLAKAYEKIVNAVKTGRGDAYFKPSVPLWVEENNIFPKDWFDEFVRVPVRQYMVYAPRQYLNMLESLYGDWQSLPPEKDRKPDHFKLEGVEIW